MSVPDPDPPRLADIPEGNEHCGACAGVQSSTPRQVTNRHGLDRLDYRVGDWAQFRASLHAGLSDASFEPLRALLTRDDDDFAIALIDAFACSADVLGFYTERIAQESYLATATERVSLQEMGRLIGYALRPGVAAETLLAFSVETPPTPPAALAPEPGVFISGVPDAVTLPAGFRVQSLPGQDEKPQVFETVEVMLARPQWNAMRALADADTPPGFGSRETWLAGTGTQLRPGDMLLFVGPQFEADPGSNRWDARMLTEVEVDAAAGRTRVAWDEPLGSVTPHVTPADPATIHALRERGAIFGHNAPDWSGMNDEYKAAYLGYDSVDKLTSDDRREWRHFDIWAPGSDSIETQSFIGAHDAAGVLREAVRASVLQQARDGVVSVSRMAASGAGFAQTVAQLPAKMTTGWLDVAHQVPDALSSLASTLMAPVTTLSEETANSTSRMSEVLDRLGEVARRLPPR